MVLGIITAVAACPAIVGTNQAVMQGQKSNAREKHRGLKTALFVNCSTASRGGREVNGGQVVLRENKVGRSTASSSQMADKSWTLTMVLLTVVHRSRIR
jgi:hypothetical protein